MVKNLKNDFRLCDRVKRLQTIRGVGEVLALTWALEVGEPGVSPRWDTRCAIAALPAR